MPTTSANSSRTDWSGCLGYVVEIAGVRVYRAGDCIPYRRARPRVRALGPHLALLPINGRDFFRETERNLVGNMDAREAARLAHDIGAHAGTHEAVAEALAERVEPGFARAVDEVGLTGALAGHGREHDDRTVALGTGAHRRPGPTRTPIR